LLAKTENFRVFNKPSG